MAINADDLALDVARELGLAPPADPAPDPAPPVDPAAPPPAPDALGEVEKLRGQVADYEPLRGIAQMIKSDPSLLSKIQAAIVNAGNPPPPQYREAPREDPAVAENMMNDLRQRMAMDPAKTTLEIVNEAMRRASESAQAGPMAQLSDVHVETFKNTLASNDKIFKAGVKEFDQILSRYPKGAIAAASSENRNELLQLAADAARGRVLARAFAAADKANPKNTEIPPPYSNARPANGRVVNTIPTELKEQFGDMLDEKDLLEIAKELAEGR